MRPEEVVFHNAEIMITGGTGSLGKTLIKYLNLCHSEIKGIRIYSRDELKQSQLREVMKNSPIPIAYILGDIRDYQRLNEAMLGVDYVIHTAALKQVPTAEENPLEYIKTNIQGTENVMRSCIYNNVKKAILVSTDKAVEPINLYGSSKMCAEKIWLNAGVYYGKHGPTFSVVRYGNVTGSRGSIGDIINRGNKISVPITDPLMTRYWIHLNEVVSFIIDNIIPIMKHGFIYIPYMISCSLKTYFYAMGIKEKNWVVVGIRPGEKIHEMIYNQEEKERVERCGSYITIHPKKDFKFKNNNHNNREKNTSLTNINFTIDENIIKQLMEQEDL